MHAMSVEITVRGSHTAYRSPERATVRLRVGLEGPRAEDVNAGVAQQAAAVGETVRRLHDPERGPVTWWSSSQVRSWASRPWNKDGKRLPLVHHAVVDLQAKFADFPALGRWLAEVMDQRGVAVDGVEWTLTEEHRRRLLDEVRAGAVADARDKATAYAAALGLTRVDAVALADAGMLGEGLHSSSGEQVAMFSRSGQAADVVVDLVPEDVSVSVQVDARFVADH